MSTEHTTQLLSEHASALVSKRMLHALPRCRRLVTRSPMLTYDDHQVHARPACTCHFVTALKASLLWRAPRSADHHAAGACNTQRRG